MPITHMKIQVDRTPETLDSVHCPKSSCRTHEVFIFIEI